MDVYMLVLRLVHFFSGIFWVGATFAMIGFVVPTAQSLGPVYATALGWNTLFARNCLRRWANNALRLADVLAHLRWSQPGRDV